MIDYIMAFIEFLKQFSYFGVFLALCFEFVPAEVVLPLAGYWVHQGEFNIHMMALAGAIGGTVGPLTLYLLGKLGGRPVVEKYGKYFLVNEKQIDAADRFFQNYGAGVVFVARFLPLVRTAISIPAGITKMSVYKFSLYTFLAMYPITYLYIYLGMQLGENWGKAGELFKDYGIKVGFVLFVVVSVYYFVMNKSKKKNSKNNK